MGKYNGAVITTAGQNLIAQAIAESKTVTFTTAQASSHVYPSSTDFEALTALTDVEKTVDINYAGVYSSTVMQVSARFDNDGVDTAYLINTLGFFAKVGTGTPILFAVATAITPDQMPVFDADNPSAFIYNMQITVQNAESVTVTVNPAGAVTVDQLAGLVEQTTLDHFISVTVPTTGWTGTAPDLSVNITVTGMTSDKVPFVTVDYPSAVSVADKKAIDKAAALLTELVTNNGSVTVKACAIPATAIPLSLRGV